MNQHRDLSALESAMLNKPRRQEPMTSTDYPYIRAWGRYLSSSHEYIQDQVERARKQHAPADAVYEIYDSNGPTGRWETTAGVVSPHARAVLGLPPLQADSNQRVCLRCGKDLTDEMGCYVFVEGKPAPDHTVKGGSGPQVLLCVEHGSNGANGLSREEFGRLYRKRYGRDPQWPA